MVYLSKHIRYYTPDLKEITRSFKIQYLNSRSNLVCLDPVFILILEYQ